MLIMKIEALMNFDKDGGYVGIVNKNNILSGFVNFDKMNICNILFEAKKQNILMKHLIVKEITNNKIFVGNKNLKISECVDLVVNKGVEVFLTTEKDISYERLCKGGIVKFLGNFYLSSVVESPDYLKHENIFKILSNVNVPKKATSASLIKNCKKMNSKKTIPKFAEDIMTVNPITCRNTETVIKIRKIMAKNNFNHIIITDEKNIPTGIVSTEDVTTYKGIMGGDLDGISNTKIDQIMNRKPWCATLQTPFIDLMHSMIDNRIGSLPIINRSGEVKGMVTKRDILEGIKIIMENSKEIKEKIYSIKASEIMNKNISLCFEDDSAFKKDIEMAKYKIKYALVIDRNTKKLIGTISPNVFVFDMIKKSIKNIKIKEIMDTNIKTIDENSCLINIMDILLEKHLSFIPILEKDAIIGQAEWWKVFEKLVQILSPFYAKM